MVYSSRQPLKAAFRGFTLVELLVVIGIILVLVGMSLPAIKSLGKSNDQSQAVNLVRAMISAARSIAISQHRQAGVVFFEETSAYSSPVNSAQTAMQIFVESYAQPALPSGATEFTYYSTGRQYLPAGVRLAALSDNTSGAGNSASPARAILFDANGQLILRDGLFTRQVVAGTPGSYTNGTAFGDWNFLSEGANTAPNGAVHAFSSPGFFVYSKNEYDGVPIAGQLAWIKKNASVIIVNGNTGGILQ